MLYDWKRIMDAYANFATEQRYHRTMYTVYFYLVTLTGGWFFAVRLLIIAEEQSHVLPVFKLYNIMLTLQQALDAKIYSW